MAEILIVDDNADIRRLYRAMLGSAYTIFEAQDGVTAVGMIQKVHPQLVFMDVMMPGELNGLEALSRVREDPLLNHIPIIMVTARGQEIDLANAQRHGADGYVVKPFGLKELAIWTDKYLK